MPGLRIQFLTLVVLVARSLADSQPECACKCSEADDDVCDFIDRQRTKVIANEEQIKKHADIIRKREVYFRDVQRPIFDVVNGLVETHINSVLKDAVHDGTPTENPEDSAEENEAPDLALKRTRDYLTRVLKDILSELKETADQTKQLRGGQEEAEKRWADERRQLLARLDEVEKSSLAIKNELSSEIRQLEKTNRERREELSASLGSRLKELEDKFTLYKDITEIEKTLGNLSFEIGRGKTNDSAAVQNGEKCTDGQYPGYCEQIVEAKYCTHDYYRRICCAACTKSGQLPPD